MGVQLGALATGEGRQRVIGGLAGIAHPAAVKDCQIGCHMGYYTLNIVKHKCLLAVSIVLS